jgi:titin
LTSPTFSIVNNINKGSFTISNLQDSSYYSVKIIATNQAGDSLESNQLGQYTYGIPTEPFILDYKSYPGNQIITLYYLSPSDNGRDQNITYEYTLDNGVTFNSIQHTQTSEYMNGFTYKIYSGYFYDDTNWFIGKTPQYSGYVTNMSDINTATNGFVPLDNSWESYSVEWTGYFYAPVTGTYTFYTNSDDASYLWIGDVANNYNNGNATVNNGGLHGMIQASGSVSLISGNYYPIRIQFGENGGGDNCIVSFSGPGIALTNNFNNYVFVNKQPLNLSTITGLTNGTSYTVKLRSVNQAGNSIISNSYTTIPYTIPNAPVISSVDKGGKSLIVNFTPSFDGGSSITGYKYSINNGPLINYVNLTIISAWYGNLNGVNGSNVLNIVRNLVNSNAQSFIAGDSLFGDPQSGVTKNFYMTYAYNGITQTFSCVQNTLVTFPTYNTIPTNKIYISRLLNGDPLADNTQYTVDIVASNIAGDSISSASFLQQTTYDLPSSPTITSIEKGIRSLVVYFNPPNYDGGSSIKNYRYQVDQNDITTPSSIDYNLNKFTIANLSNGTTYNIKILAVNDAGNGSMSDSSSQTTYGVPSEPIITSINKGIRSLEVFFTIPSNNGGLNVTGYKYSIYGSDPSILVTPTINENNGSFTISSLSNGTFYQVKLSATNDAGDGLISTMIQSTYGVPTEPVISSITRGLRNLNVFFNIPTNNGGLSITGYKYSVDGSNPSININPINGSFNISNLLDGTTYQVKLLAVNDAGDGIISQLSQKTFSVSTPPTITSIQRGLRSLTVSFTQPTDDGGTPITSYKYSIDGQIFSYTFTTGSGGTGGTGHLSGGGGAGGLIVKYNGQIITPNVQATQGGGANGGYGGFGGQGFGSGGGGGGYWYAVGPLDPGVGANGFAYIRVGNSEYFAQSSSTYIIPESGTCKVLLMGGGSSGGLASSRGGYGGGAGYIRTYSFQVTSGSIMSISIGSGGVGYNSSGQNTTISIGSTTYLAEGANLQDGSSKGGTGGLQSTGQTGGSNGSGGQGSSTFTNITTFIPAIVNYGSNFTTISKENTTFIITKTFENSDLSNGTVYLVVLKSVNEVGESSESFMKQMTFNVPVKPLISSVLSSDKTLTVNFTNPDEGGTPITQYYYNIDGGSFIDLTLQNITTSGSNNSFSISNLVNGQIYTINIYSVNIVGNSEIQEWLNARPYTFANAPIINSITRGIRSLLVNFTTPNGNGSSISSYKYSVNGQTPTTQVSLSSITNSDNNNLLNIDNLQNGVTYQIKLLAVNEAGDGLTSSVSSQTTYNVPSKPINLSVVPQPLQLNISFVQENDGDRPISNYQFSLNGGPFQNCDPIQIESPVVLVHPTVKVRSFNQIRIRAINEVGESPQSEIVLGTVPCLLKGMKIRMKDGTEKPVEDLKEGDEIVDIMGRIIPIQKVFHNTVLGNYKNVPFRIPKDFF